MYGDGAQTREFTFVSDVVGQNLELRHEPVQPGDVGHTDADMTRVREVLGFQSMVGLEEGSGPIGGGSMHEYRQGRD